MPFRVAFQIGPQPGFIRARAGAFPVGTVSAFGSLAAGAFLGLYLGGAAGRLPGQLKNLVAGQKAGDLQVKARLPAPDRAARAGPEQPVNAAGVEAQRRQVALDGAPLDRVSARSASTRSGVLRSAAMRLRASCAFSPLGNCAR